MEIETSNITQIGCGGKLCMMIADVSKTTINTEFSNNYIPITTSNPNNISFAAGGFYSMHKWSHGHLYSCGDGSYGQLGFNYLGQTDRLGHYYGNDTSINLLTKFGDVSFNDISRHFYLIQDKHLTGQVIAIADIKCGKNFAVYRNVKTFIFMGK